MVHTYFIRQTIKISVQLVIIEDFFPDSYSRSYTVADAYFLPQQAYNAYTLSIPASQTTVVVPDRKLLSAFKLLKLRSINCSLKNAANREVLLAIVALSPNLHSLGLYDFNYN